MFKRIMMPVDLAHVESLGQAVTVAADLAGHYGAELVFVGVTATAPSRAAHSPEEYRDKLAAFAAQKASRHAITTRAQTIISHDPAVELDDVLIKAVGEVGADLVVMATHVPNMADMILPAHGGALARHTDVSVFLVRHA